MHTKASISPPNVPPCSMPAELLGLLPGLLLRSRHSDGYAAACSPASRSWAACNDYGPSPKSPACSGQGSQAERGCTDAVDNAQTGMQACVMKPVLQTTSASAMALVDPCV